MRRSTLFFVILTILSFVFLPASAQDKLAGRWEGKIQSMQGERPTTAVFKKEADGYAGKMPGLRPGTEIQLKDVKLDGDKVTAKADVETPQANVTINYTFTLAGDELKGQGAVDFGGQTITFEMSLKRVSNDTEAPLAAAGQAAQAPGGGGQRQQPRNEVSQPQQKQSIDYFAGQWSYSYIGRESALGPAPRDCTVSFTKRADGVSVEGATQCRHDGGMLKGNTVIVFDEAAKSLSFTEKTDNGVTLTSKGNWSSPIAIRFTIDPVKAKGQTLQLRRTISIVAAHSFTVTEELSEDGGPFVRLGNAVYTKAVK
ncbi:MAG: hypothetical protein SF339_24405 [Blastocatellia bacterium]|nr:hypothetical protein [Blastocatellia bacterium]